MNHRSSARYTLAAMMLAASLTPVHAEDQHAGDVQPFVSNGAIQLNATLFEADFSDLPGGAFGTDDPGYDANTALGAFTAGNWLQFEGMGVLKFWNGAQWGAPAAGETFRIDDALGLPSDLNDDTIFSGNGVTKPIGVIGEIDLAGDLHEHLDMSIRTSGGVLGGSVGAYWITLRLIETAPFSNIALKTSAPFDIIFNRGLAPAGFEAAVAAVPLPPAAFLFGSALLGLCGLRRKGRSCTA